jgi:6-phosphogluconolactonase (cycloisomerase 2 family)
LSGQLFAARKNPRGLAIDRSGIFLDCRNYGANTVSAFRIDRITGALEQIPVSPYGAGDGPFAVGIF